jgi:hypothetical protein
MPLAIQSIKNGIAGKSAWKTTITNETIGIRTPKDLAYIIIPDTDEISSKDTGL